jgi:hypothetical protein
VRCQLALKILQIAAAFGLGAGFIVSSVLLDSNSPFSIQSAFAEQGGNGGGNGGGNSNGNGNGASGSTGTESKKSTPKDKVRPNIKSNLEALGAAKKAVASAIKKVVATQGTAQQALELYLQADVDLMTAAAAIIAKEKALANDPGNPKLQKALISARLIFASANETVAFALVNYKKAVDAADAAQASLEAAEAAAIATVAKLKTN